MGDDVSHPTDRVSEEVLTSISTPDHIESRLGTIEFTDGAPSTAGASCRT
jgi:hypothetical protein